MAKYSEALQLKTRSIFRNLCHQAVVLGYGAMYSKPADFKQWSENKISYRLLFEMKKLSFLKSNNIIVSREPELDDNDILYGDKESEYADRIDFIFSKNWVRKLTFEYYGEAKNISCSNWTKTKKGSPHVDASSQRGRYISTGIERLVFGKYSDLNGFLIGYVVNGNAEENVGKLNSLINTRKLPPKVGLIENQHSIRGYNGCYSSKNMRSSETIELEHIFLAFDVM